MEDFLNKLYNYEYFGVYLMIAIAVLVLLFIIVLFFGKKDQKKREIEETKKLQQINNPDAFKEENNVASVEVPQPENPEPVMTQEKLENDTIIVPNINNLGVEENKEENVVPEPVLPKEDVVVDIPTIKQPDETKQPEEENPMDQVNNEVSMPEVSPILDKVEEKPLVFNEQPVEEPAFTVPEENKPVDVPLTDVPDFNFDEIVSGVEEIKQENDSKPTEVFSSVYVPEKEEVELPKIEENKVKDDDLDIELPTLKKEEEKVELPELNDYNLDNIAGEDYNINN